MESFDFVEELQVNERNAATRRKNEWKFARRRKEILNDSLSKPLHYYSKNMPESHAVDKRQVRRQKRQIDNYENQLDELFDDE